MESRNHETNERLCCIKGKAVMKIPHEIGHAMHAMVLSRALKLEELTMLLRALKSKCAKRIGVKLGEIQLQ